VQYGRNKEFETEKNGKQEEKNMIYAGCHISSSKGYEAMGKTALKLGADTFAFFTRNPRGGNVKELKVEDVRKLQKLLEEHHFGKLVAHAPYTLNPCAARPEVRDFAFRAFREDLERLEWLPGNYYNFHPGSHVGQGAEQGILFIAELLNECLKPEQSTIVLLETMAGKGSEIGRTFEELKRIIDRVTLSDKVGVCLDTCHVWDGGYDIVENLDGVLKEFDRIIGLDRLKAIHCNDSLNELGAGKDRHAKLGEGKIGLDAFRKIASHPVLQGLPFIMETPNDEEGWKKEIALMHEFGQ
jgi:deoxyribonuclease-4